MTVTMTQAAKMIDAPQQQLYYFYKKGLLTGHDIGAVILVDPEQARRELEAVGFYRRQAARRRGRQLREQAKRKGGETTNASIV